MEKVKERERSKCQRSSETRTERKTVTEFSTDFSRLTVCPSPALRRQISVSTLDMRGHAGPRPSSRRQIGCPLAIRILSVWGYMSLLAAGLEGTRLGFHLPDLKRQEPSRPRVPDALKRQRGSVTSLLITTQRDKYCSSSTKYTGLKKKNTVPSQTVKGSSRIHCTPSVQLLHNLYYILKNLSLLRVLHITGSIQNQKNCLVLCLY